MECSVEHGKCAVEHSELAGRAKQVSNYIARRWIAAEGRTLTRRNSQLITTERRSGYAVGLEHGRVHQKGAGPTPG